ncbi:MAG: bifunctional hydroxymethylpyrimidine kinase/phosphomethylpyrimidine kinase [Wenzhouxiangellaceae bacterium]|nr:bifunctional hydroxymethylpyrimidine kinase/phosphomethylpyrimidine kinase [Wenzhouxiangellaceae bacterium]
MTEIDENPRDDGPETVANPQQTVWIAALSIAGSDSGGGAGIQADLKTFSAFGVFGATALTAATVQNTAAVEAVQTLGDDFVAGQIRACLADLPVAAIKTGMLGAASTVERIADTLAEADPEGALPLVVDPVMVATSGARLIDDDAVAALQERLLPRARLVTPNLPEARLLAGLEDADDPEVLATALRDRFGCDVLVKGGHGSGETLVDVLADRTGRNSWSRRRVPGRFHGTGCALSAAITALLAHGEETVTACDEAGAWLQQQIGSARPGRAGGLGILPFLPAPRRG